MRDRYLITGAQGFIGRYFVRHLLDRFSGAIVLGLGRSSEQVRTFLHQVTYRDETVIAPLPEKLRNLDPHRYSYISGSHSPEGYGELLRDFCPTVVVHLAASWRGGADEQVFQTNLRSTEDLLTAIRISGSKIRFFLLVSSGGVYGNQKELPIKETAAASPIDPYSRSKFLSENLALSFGSESGTSMAIARVFNVFGPGQDELHFAGRMAGQIAAFLAEKSAPVVRVGCLSSTRDYLDVRDVCSAICTILEQSLEGISNVGSGVETNVGHLLQVMLNAAEVESVVEIKAETRESDNISRQCANVGRLAGVGFVPQYTPSQTCRDMLEYYARVVYQGPTAKT
jgi:nucleoside-diphosphate-sugar epimerase